MKIATWNVNGIRARAGQVEQWLDAERPDVLCLQEIKASPEQVPLTLAGRDDYWSCWHGSGGYSGVALLVHRDLAGAECRASHPAFDFEHRVASVTRADLEILSVYVPNGGKDFAAKMQFLEALGNYVAEAQRDGRRVVVCGDLNVALTDLDLHPKERKAERHRPATGRARAAPARDRSRADGRPPRAAPRRRGALHLVGSVAGPAATQHRLAHRLRAGHRRARRHRHPRRVPARVRHERSRATGGRVRVGGRVRRWGVRPGCPSAGRRVPERPGERSAMRRRRPARSGNALLPTDSAAARGSPSPTGSGARRRE